MPEDDIVGEIRRVKEAHAARYGYDVRKMVRALRRKEQKSGRTVVSLPAQRLTPEGSPR